MLELAILALLKERPLHGYELKKRLADHLPPRAGVSFGSLYPALNRLERAGAVTAASVRPTATAMPMTGSFAGESAAFRSLRPRVARGPRGKKVYDITPVGDDRLTELIEAPADDDRSFSVKVAFCRLVDPLTRVSLLQRRRDTLATRLAQSARDAAGRSEALDPYVRSLLEHDRETTERDIAWLDRLLATERATTTTEPTRRRETPRPSTHDSHEPAPTADGGTR